MIAALRDRKARSCDRMTADCQTEQWLIPYLVAAQRIRDRASHGRFTCLVDVPESNVDEQKDWAEWVWEVVHHYGYVRRPGGRKGHVVDAGHLEREGPTLPGPEPAMPVRRAAIEAAS
jgi:hypothetical protein